MQNNSQFIRTDRAIQSALIALVNRKPFEKVTVQDILDETPVSRATFYKHYHDKYEIAEKLQTEFMSIQKDIIATLCSATPSQVPVIVQNFSAHYREIMLFLMRVQTENVNLPMAMVAECEKIYLESATTLTRAIESNIYGAAMTAFQLTALSELNENITARGASTIFMNVMLRLIGLDQDPEVRKFLKNKINMLQETK